MIFEMKGLFILSYNKKPGAYIDREYPRGISDSDQFKIDTVDQNKIYSFNRMRNSNPNYIYMKIKGVQIASYFSGIEKNFIGFPNQCVCIILDNENPTLYEELLKEITKELLPMLAYIQENDKEISEGLSNDPKYQNFDEILEQKFNYLVENLGKSHPITITPPPQFETIDKSIQQGNESKSGNIPKENSHSEDLKNRLNELEMRYEEKIDKIKNELMNWKNKVKELTEEKVSLTHEIEEKEDSLKVQKDKSLIWRKQLETANEINYKLKDSVNNLIEKVKSLEDEIENSADSKKVFDLRINIAEINAELEVSRDKNQKNDKKIDSLNNEIVDLKNRLEIAQTLKINSNITTDSELDSKLQEILEEMQLLKTKLVEAKKTIKVQRREIVNLHKLLDLS